MAVHGTRGKKHRKDINELIPTAWFVDLANLLIFYFLATTSLQKVQGFQTEMPAAEKGQSKAESKMPTVRAHNGQIFFNDQEVTADKLPEQLATLKLKEKTGEEKVVMFETSGQVSYQEYFGVMSAISTAGGVVGLITEAEEGEGGGK